MNITVVGGEAIFANQAYMAALREHNVILEHFDLRQAVKDIPSQTDVVVLLGDACSDLNTNNLDSAAARVGAKVLRVSRRWAKAEPVLRAEGLIPPSKSGKQPSSSDKQTTAVDYIKDQRKAGRDPSPGEIRGLLRAQFGPNTKISQNELGRWFQLGRTAPMPPVVDGNTIRSAARALVEDSPALTTPESANELVAQVKELSKPSGECHWPETLGELVQMEVKALREEWESNIEVRKKAVRRWARRIWQEWKEGTGEYPGSTYIKRMGIEVFGRHISHEYVVQGRMEVLGDWAREVSPHNQLQFYLGKICKALEVSCPGDLKYLLENGLVKGFLAGRRWWTSTAAIDEYVQALASEKAKKQMLPPDMPSRQFQLPAPSEPDPEEVALLAELSERVPAKDVSPEPEEKPTIEEQDVPDPEIPDLGESFVEAVTRIVEGRMLELSSVMADLVTEGVLKSQRSGLLEYGDKLVETIQSALTPLTDAIVRVVSSEMKGAHESLADIHSRHSAAVIKQVSDQVEASRNIATDIRTWLRNINQKVQALNSEDLTPEVLMSEVGDQLKAIEVSISGLSSNKTVGVGMDLSSMSTRLNTRLDILQKTLDTLQGTQERQPQTTSLNPLDLIKMAAAQGLRVTFEPL